MKAYKILFFLAPFLYFSHLESQIIHAFMVGDTVSQIKEASYNDLKHVKKELSEISEATNLPVHYIPLIGTKATSRHLISWIRNTDSTSDDILFFYYTGHGVHPDNLKTIWPCFFLPVKDEVLDSSLVMKELLKRPHQLCIFLADCCNTYVNSRTSNYDFLLDPEPQRSFAMNSSKKSYNKLFLSQKGYIIATGAKPGKRSWCTPQGSIFTNAFLACLKNEVSASNPDWTRLLRKAKKQCKNFQKPQSKVYVKSK